jgi:hypothetical protein
MRSRRLRIGLVGVLAVLALGLVACGAKKGNNGIATAGGNNKASPTASVDPAEQMRQYAACMRAHGVDMADPQTADGPANGTVGNGGPVVASGGPVGMGPDNPTFQAAQTACRSLAPNGGNMPKANAQQIEQLRQFATCMRAHGVNMPDPDPDTGGIMIQNSGGPNTGLDPQSPTFKAAQEACRNLMPTGGPAGGSTQGTGQ